MRSMSSNERLEDLLSELYRVEWDVILLSETWRQSKEIWETQQGHIVVESGQFVNKHGVAIVEQKMEEPDQMGALRERTHCCNVDLGQQTPDCTDERVHATQWIC